MRVLRTLRIAISAPANNPFTITRVNRINSSGSTGTVQRIRGERQPARELLVTLDDMEPVIALTDPDFLEVEAEPELAGAFSIQSIPTLMVFRDGILLFEQAGALPAAALEELVRQVRALDMEQVRREVAARQAVEGPPES